MMTPSLARQALPPVVTLLALIAGVAHEIRTPMSGVLGTSQC